MYMYFISNVDVPQELWEQLKDAGKAQTSHLYSDRAWPIDGGKLLCSKGSTPRRELLLTGHEDGTVRFWDAGSVNLTPIYKFSTAQYFTGDDIVGMFNSIFRKRKYVSVYLYIRKNLKFQMKLSHHPTIPKTNGHHLGKPEFSILTPMMLVWR